MRWPNVHLWTIPDTAQPDVTRTGLSAFSDKAGQLNHSGNLVSVSKDDLSDGDDAASIAIRDSVGQGLKPLTSIRMDVINIEWRTP